MTTQDASRDARLEELRSTAARRGTDILARAMRELELVDRTRTFTLSTADGGIVACAPISGDGAGTATIVAAHALHGTAPSPEMQRPLARVARLVAALDEVGVAMPATITSDHDSAFLSFARSRAWSDDLRTLEGYDCGETPTPVPGYVYLGSYAIEAQTDAWPESVRAEGSFHLVVGNRSVVSDDLSALERDLYDTTVRPDDD